MGPTNLFSKGDDAAGGRDGGEEGGHEALDASLLGSIGQDDLVTGIEDRERGDDNFGAGEGLGQIIFRPGEVDGDESDAALLEGLVSGAVDGRLASEGCDFLTRG
jgi:hypothetical protein